MYFLKEYRKKGGLLNNFPKTERSLENKLEETENEMMKRNLDWCVCVEPTPKFKLGYVLPCSVDNKLVGEGILVLAPKRLWCCRSQHCCQNMQTLFVGEIISFS